MLKLLKLSVLSLACLLLISCAKNNVKETVAVANTGLPTPNTVLIYNFSVDPADVKTASGVIANVESSIKKTSQSQEASQLAREVSDAMATELTQKIAALGLNAIRADQSTRVAPGAIIITGAFVNIDAGNSTRRNAVGLGLGQSSLDSSVSVLTPSNQVLISFDAHADSGNMPGAAVTAPISAANEASTAAMVATNVASGGIKNYKSDSARQAKKMAENVAAQLATYFAQQGWINSSQAQ